MATDLESNTWYFNIKESIYLYYEIATLYDGKVNVIMMATEGPNKGIHKGRIPFSKIENLYKGNKVKRVPNQELMNILYVQNEKRPPSTARGE